MSGNDKIWWYGVGQDKFGPYSEEELRDAARQGLFSARDLVWRDGLPNWVAAESIQGLWAGAPEAAAAVAATPQPPDMFAAPAPLSVSQAVVQHDRPMMSFADAVKSCLGKYVNFSGRAPRAEYWWFVLFSGLCGVVLGLLAAVAGVSQGTADAMTMALQLALLLPSLAVAARRLHDTGRSGWWQLIAVTIIGIIPLLIWYVSAGDDEPNEHGDPV